MRTFPILPDALHVKIYREEGEVAVAMLTADDLDRLHNLTSQGLRNGSPEDGALVEQIALLAAQETSAVTSTGEDA